MNTYHKIQTVFLRDLNNKAKTLLEGQFSKLEFEYLKNNIWDWREKVDGTNIRVIWERGSILFKGKNENSDIPGALVNKLRERFCSESGMKLFSEIFGDVDVCLYNEGFGRGIQSGGKYSKEQDIVLFDVKIGDWWLKRSDVVDISERFKLPVVPIIGHGTLLEMVEVARKGFHSVWGKFYAEGIVATPSIELKGRNGDRIITKVKYNDFER